MKSRAVNLIKMSYYGQKKLPLLSSHHHQLTGSLRVIRPACHLPALLLELWFTLHSPCCLKSSVLIKPPCLQEIGPRCKWAELWQTCLLSPWDR